MLRSVLRALMIVSLAMPLAGTARAQSGFDDPGARSASGGVDDLVAVNPKVDGGAVTLGAASQVVILFRNDGIKPVTSGAINLYPSSNVSTSVALNQCAQEPLEPLTVCAVALSVKGLQAGNYRIEMLMRHDGKSKLITSTITGSVDSSGDTSEQLISDIEAIPSEVDFGSLNASRQMIRSIVLRNITSEPVNIGSVGIEAHPQAGYSLKTDCAKLETGQACIATVTWAPVQSGPATGVLIVQHDGPTGVATVDLKGIYEPEEVGQALVFPEAVPGKGLLVSSQTEVAFGDDIAASSAITLSLVNVGDEALTISDIKLSNSENGLSLAKSGCRAGSVLEPIEACPLTLTWEPVKAGTIIDDIQVRHDGARGILVLPVRGTAEAAVNKDSKAFTMTTGDVVYPAIPVMTDDELDAQGEGLEQPTAPSAPRSSEPGVVNMDLTGILDGFTITSLAPGRAIINGPGGSRVVSQDEQTVLAGILWKVMVKPGAVEFRNGSQKVLLLFDRSLSSVNQGSGESSSSSSTGAETTATTSTN